MDGDAGEDKVLEMMRSMGLPDPGTLEAAEWVRENIHPGPLFMVDVPDDWDDDIEDEDEGEDYEEDDPDFPYEPYPDYDLYCPKCGEVLSIALSEAGQYDMCNHCGYNTRPE